MANVIYDVIHNHGATEAGLTGGGSPIASKRWAYAQDTRRLVVNDASTYRYYWDSTRLADTGGNDSTGMTYGADLIGAAGITGVTPRGGTISTADSVYDMMVGLKTYMDAAVSGTTNTLAIFTSAHVVGNSIITYSAGTFTQTYSTAGSTASFIVLNGDNTNGASNAQLSARVGGASAGDPYLLLNISGVRNWSIGIDNSASDVLAFSLNNGPGTNDFLTIDTTGRSVFYSNIAVEGNAAATSYIRSKIAATGVQLVADIGAQGNTNNPRFEFRFDEANKNCYLIFTGSSTPNNIYIRNAAATDLVQITNGGDLNVLSGRASIGSGGTSTNVGLQVKNTLTLTGNITQYGVYSASTMDSGCQTAEAFYARVNSAASVFTLLNAIGLYVDNPVVGSGSSITNNYAIYINAMSSGGTSNYAFFSSGAGLVKISDTTQATAYNAASVVLVGGLGVAKNIFANGGASFASSVQIGTIGIITGSDLKLSSSNTLTGTSPKSLYITSSFPSSATSSISCIEIDPSTQASVFTCVDFRGVFVKTPTLGAGSIVTNMYGLTVQSITGGATINRAIKTSLGMVEFGDDLLIAKSTTGTVTATISNTNASSTAHARLLVKVNGSDPPGGDPLIVFNNGADVWAFGHDNAAGYFTISQGGSLGANNVFTMDTAGQAKFVMGDLRVERSSASTVGAMVYNTLNTANPASALLTLQVGGTTSTGDPLLNFIIPGGSTWGLGGDNSVSGDPFVLAASSSLGTSNVMSIATSGNIVYTLDGTATNLSTTVYTDSSDTNVSNTTTETTVLGSGSGTKTIAANGWRVGRNIRFYYCGAYLTTGTPTLRLKFKIGSNILIDTGAVTMAANIATAKYVIFQGNMIVRGIGVSGQIYGTGTLFVDGIATAISFSTIGAGISVVVDTTSSLALDITATWGTANALNSITTKLLTIDIQN